MAETRDRIGLGWRGELAAGILEHIESIDVLEVIAEDWMSRPRSEMGALRALAAARPLMLHGVAMGLASSVAVERKRVDHMARLAAQVRADCWSEHLAFVRGGGVEIGHLAAPPRTLATVEGTLANLETASRIVGTRPAVENIATLLDPPASTMGECEWTSDIVGNARAPMLLDLHNLYANALNFGADPYAMLAAMPLESVEIVHLSGGRWIGEGGDRRLLDDHIHDPPDPVYEMLESLAQRAPRALTVIIERDGHYPAMDLLLSQVARARGAVERGRTAREAGTRKVA